MDILKDDIEYVWNIDYRVKRVGDTERLLFEVTDALLDFCSFLLTLSGLPLLIQNCILVDYTQTQCIFPSFDSNLSAVFRWAIGAKSHLILV